MQRFRVECNFGCRYFTELVKACRYFNKCRKKQLDVQLWLVNYYYCLEVDRYYATQELMAYCGTCLITN